MSMMLNWDQIILERIKHCADCYDKIHEGRSAVLAFVNSVRSFEAVMSGDLDDEYESCVREKSKGFDFLKPKKGMSNKDLMSNKNKLDLELSYVKWLELNRLVKRIKSAHSISR